MAVCEKHEIIMIGSDCPKCIAALRAVLAAAKALLNETSESLVIQALKSATLRKAIEEAENA